MALVFVFILIQTIWVHRGAYPDSAGVLSSAPVRVESTEIHVKNNPSVTAFLEPPSTLQGDVQPLPRRNTHRALLNKLEFPTVGPCSTLQQDFHKVVVNHFGNFSRADPFLPWLHTFFPSQDNSRVLFLGQNRRNCDAGKDRQESMQLWAPQLALYQPVPLVRTNYKNGTSVFRIGGREGAPQSAKDDDVDNEVIIPETRFLCRFHSTMDAISPVTTHSKFMFNYEYVSWRKGKAMIKQLDNKQSEFWLSQLIFYCDIPAPFQSALKTSIDDTAQVLVDLVPIRTPPRSRFWLTPEMIGPLLYTQHQVSTNSFDAVKAYGQDHVLPELQESGRFANLPVCPNQAAAARTAANEISSSLSPSKPYRMVLCTWTSASYHRRGEDEDQPLDDTTLRLREWLIFHRMVGADHVVIYDNTQGVEEYKDSPLYQVLQEFPKDYVSYQPWPAVICNNNRPGHAQPGDRSSQYAAEASCRERYGPLTDWMSFIDTDEYLAPMRSFNKNPAITWAPLLDDFERRDIAILKFKSARSYTRVHMMDPMEDQASCGDPFTERFHQRMTPEPCLVRRPTETFLKTYNCDSVKRPRPERFQRAMKQLYRPDYVLSHFVHYSTVTEFNARYHEPEHPLESPHRPLFDPDKEVFVDELNEGVLIHTRSVVPRETMFRSSICQVDFKRTNCLLGYECPDSVEWMDDLGREQGARTKKHMNPHHDEHGNFCSCWVNLHVEEVWVPRLEQALEEHMQSRTKI